MKRKPQSTQSLTTAIVSDIHFNKHHTRAWSAFCEWVCETSPHRIVLNGDLIDAEQLSSYDATTDTPPYVLPELKALVRWTNWLRTYCDELVIVPGNHDERLTKATRHKAQALKGVPGLSFREICQNVGMHRDVKWVEQDHRVRGIYVNGFLIRHGHKGQGKFGGGKHVAATTITKTMGESTIVGHHHRAQLYSQRCDDRVAVTICNPCMVQDERYSDGRDADWQRGFTIIEGVTHDRGTAYPIVMTGLEAKGEPLFAHAGRLYGAEFFEPEFEAAA